MRIESKNTSEHTYMFVHKTDGENLKGLEQRICDMHAHVLYGHVMFTCMCK